MGGQRAVPKKKASGWDRLVLQSGGSEILGAAHREEDAPDGDWGEPSARFSPGGACRPRSGRAPPPAACTPRAHLTRPRRPLRPGGAPSLSGLPRFLRAWASPVAAASGEGMEGRACGRRAYGGASRQRHDKAKVHTVWNLTWWSFLLPTWATEVFFIGKSTF